MRVGPLVILVLSAALIPVEFAWSQLPRPVSPERTPERTPVEPRTLNENRAPAESRATEGRPIGESPRKPDGWRGTDDRANEPRGTEIAEGVRTRVAKATRGNVTLPGGEGHLWIDYDIAPYTQRVTTTNRPEQAIVDWVLRETGYEAWHGESLSVLSASKNSLRVYHTVETQKIVADIVDRFVDSEAESYGFSVQIIALGNPNWRARALGLLRPVQTQTQGVQAWLTQKEDAAAMLAELGRRTDYRTHAPYVLVPNGQSAVIAVTRPRTYVKDLVPRAVPGYQLFEPQTGQIDEGLSLEMSPLLSGDRKTVDVALKCHVDQVEKILPVTFDLPGPAVPRQRGRVDVPQVAQSRLHERFRWPIDQVLVVGMGVVATPLPSKPSLPLQDVLLGTNSDRADLLIVIESKGSRAAATAQPPRAPRTSVRLPRPERQPR